MDGNPSIFLLQDKYVFQALFNPKILFRFSLPRATYKIFVMAVFLQYPIT